MDANDDHLKILGTHVDGLEKVTMKLRHQVTVGIMDEGMFGDVRANGGFNGRDKGPV